MISRRIWIRGLLRLALATVVPLAAAGLISCGSDEKSPTAPLLEGVVPDFELPDVNPNSATGGQPVSPRDHRGAISAWYFGTST